MYFDEAYWGEQLRHPSGVTDLFYR